MRMIPKKNQKKWKTISEAKTTKKGNKVINKLKIKM